MGLAQSRRLEEINAPGYIKRILYAYARNRSATMSNKERSKDQVEPRMPSRFNLGAVTVECVRTLTHYSSSVADFEV